MSVNIPNQGKSTSTGSTGPAFTAPESSAQQAPRAKRSWGTSQTPGNISRERTSEVLVRAKKALQDTIIKRAPKGVSVKLIDIDNTVFTSLVFSAIVVAVTPQDTNNKIVAYRTLILAGTGQTPAPYTENINGKPVTITRFDQTVFDNVYNSIIERQISAEFSGFAARNAATHIVQRELNWDDANLVDELVVSTFQSLYKELESSLPGYEDLDITKFEPSPLQATVFFGPNDQSVLGLPRRRDVGIRLQSINNAGNTRDTVNVPDRETTILEVGGFFDFLWAPATAQQNANQFFGQNTGTTKKFALRAVVTAVDQINTNMSLASYLLGLFTFSMLGDSKQMLPYFLPRHSHGHGKATFDGRDVSALAIEGGVDNFDAKSATFQPTDLGTFFDLLVHAGVVFAVDVDTTGPDSAFNDVFAAAVTNPAAGAAILRAASTLTGGLFDQFYQSDANPVLPIDERVFTGTYLGADGVLHDLREVQNYLYVANYFKTNPANIAIWTDTVLADNQPLPIRKEIQLNMIKDMVPNAVITGELQRATFTKHFVDSLAKGVAAAGLSSKVVNAAAGIEFRSSRGEASWINQALVGNVAGNVFHSGYGTNGAGFTNRGTGNPNRVW